MPQAMPRRPRGRPTKPVLSVTSITDAAIDIITHHGLSALTMTSLAASLRVSASALYNHAASKKDVLMWVQDKLNLTIDDPDFTSQPWDKALMEWARSYRECFIRHTAMIPVMAVLPVSESPHTLSMYERVITGLTGAGVHSSTALNMIVAVEALAFGAAYDATAPAGIFDPGSHTSQAPVFSGAAALRPSEPREAADQAFEAGLQAMVAGFRSRIGG